MIARSAALALLFLFPRLVLMPASADAQAPPPDAALAHARALLRSTPLIDGHNDLPWEIRRAAGHPRDVAAYDLRTRSPKHTDLDAPGAGPGRRAVLVDLCRRRDEGQRLRAGAAGAVRHRPPDDRSLSRTGSRSRCTADDIERARETGPARVAPRHGGRARDRELARRAPVLLRARRALHDA